MTHTKLEYVWTGGQGELRSKTKICSKELTHKIWDDFKKTSVNNETKQADLRKIMNVIIDNEPTSLQNNQLDKLLSYIPEWNYDGSSTEQASGDDSEVVIKPVRVYRNPFSKSGGFIVLCDTYLPNGTPHSTNTRYLAKQVFDKYNAGSEKPMFGLEHEFFVIDMETHKPLGFPSENELPPPQGPYYCRLVLVKLWKRVSRGMSR